MTNEGGTRYAVESGWSRDVSLGGHQRLLFYDEGHVRWEHPCKVVDRVQLIIAPLLNERHVVSGSAEAPTVRPSLLCTDCGLHVVVTDGVAATC